MTAQELLKIDLSARAYNYDTEEQKAFADKSKAKEEETIIAIENIEIDDYIELLKEMQAISKSKTQLFRINKLLEEKNKIGKEYPSLSNIQRYINHSSYNQTHLSLKNNKTPQERYHQDKMLAISVKYKKDFVLEFRQALEKLGLKQSDVIRSAMQDVIEKARKAL